MSHTRIAISLIAGLALTTAVGCAKKQPEAAPATAPPAAGAKAAQPAAPPTAATPIPKNHPFGKITKGMPDSEVAKILGQPTDRRDYMTGKQFIPWYYGKDTSRSDWIYKGKGHIVFVRNRYSGSLTVIEVLYDPSTP
jgi:hypothetical protein